MGGINTLVGTALMFGFYNLTPMGYWASSALSYLLASVVSFFLNKYFTFQSRRRSAAEVVRFAVCIAVCWLVAYGLAQPLVEALLASASESVRGNVALLVGMCLFTGLNYLGQRLFVFRPGTEATEDVKEEQTKKESSAK